MAGRKFHQFTDEQRRTAVIDEVERRADLRELAAFTLVFAGATHPVVATLRLAERLPETMDRALRQFDRIPTRQRRNIIASYARLMRPLRDGGAS